jgi:FAD/FMN-containing dehydrogenase
MTVQLRPVPAVAPSGDLQARLAAIVGARHVLTAELDPYLVEPRHLFRGTAACVVKPGSTAEVAALLRLCAETGTKIVPQGGNTGLVGGQIPDDSETQVILSLQRMNRLRDIDTASNTMTVEAGMTLLQAQQEAERAGRLYPLSLPSEGSCTIGGNLSTNAGGTAVLAYGTARELVNGVEVVLADGRVLSNLSKLRKDNTGYDLKHLFMGAEGTLGVITAAVLKLFPAIRTRETAMIGVADPAKALAFLGLAQGMVGRDVKTFEVISRICIDYVVTHAAGARDPLASRHPWYVLLELASERADSLADKMLALLEAGMEQGLIEDAAVAASLDQRRAFWMLREMISEVQGREGGSIKHDISVPVAAVPAFIAEAGAAVVQAVPGARIVAFGHLGDGNVHYNVSQPVGADKETFLARWVEVNEIVHAIVRAHAGSISAEHGIGRLKRDLLPRYKDPVALEVMRTLKAALDPQGLLNPGKVL